MTVAITAAFHIYFFVAKEYSVDSFQSHKKDIYRVLETNKWSNLRGTFMVMPLGEVLKNEVPEVEDFVRVIQHSRYKVEYKGEKINQNFKMVDPSFFSLFDFPLIKGSIDHFKETPNGIVLSKKKAHELFPEEDAVGKTITITRENSRTKKVTKWQLEIVGLINDIPKNSTLQGAFFINIDFYNIQQERSINSGWNFGTTQLFLYAPKLKNKEEVEHKITQLKISNFNKNNNSKWHLKVGDVIYYLQRFDQMYLNSDDVQEQEKKGSSQFVFILLIIGSLTLFLATTNYIIMNLGLNLNRTKEFNTRRYLGASKFDILKQLCLESLINVWLCFTITLLSYPLIGGVIANILNFDEQLSLQNDMQLILWYLGLISIIGILTGCLQFIISYRGIFLKSNITNAATNRIIKLLIGIQLFLFIGIISCMILVQKQVRFIQDKDLGFQYEYVLSVSTQRQNQVLLDYLNEKTYINSISHGEPLFRHQISMGDYTVSTSNKKIKALTLQGDGNYIKVHNIQLIKGKNVNPVLYFNERGHISEKSQLNYTEIIVNEEFVRKANLKNPVGTFIKGVINYKIMGVFKNVYYTPLHVAIQPTIIGYNTSYGSGTVQVSYNPIFKKEFLKDLYKFYEGLGLEETHYKRLIQEFNFKEIYKKEMQLKSLLELFTIIVLVIALLGLIAISLFITESKTKEIGVRKVNGATIKEILLLLNKDFVKWILIAFVLVTPISYYLMKNWLYNFAYKTTLSWWIFALAAVFTLFIALLTVSWQSYRAATQNPVKSLRDE
jgi:putative ABC transport system permease protein